MQQESPSQSFYIKVEGQSHSSHRSPQGVYEVVVMTEKTLAHSACAAIQVAKGSVPFLDENLDIFTIKAFLSDGREVVIPRTLNTLHDHHGSFCGRAKNYPDIITLQ